MTLSPFIPGRGGVPLRTAPAAPPHDGAAAVAASAATVKHDSRDSTDSGVGSCGTGQETTTTASVERLNNIFNGWHSSLNPGLVTIFFEVYISLKATGNPELFQIRQSGWWCWGVLPKPIPVTY